jgi:hypothetical protein
MSDCGPRISIASLLEKDAGIERSAVIHGTLGMIDANNCRSDPLVGGAPHVA